MPILSCRNLDLRALRVCFIAVAFTMCVVSCGDGVTSRPDLGFPCQGKGTESLSSDLKVEVYLDATTSMQGFAKRNSGEYVSFVQDLERQATIGWQHSQLKFYKFGDGRKLITETPVYVAASKLSFYEDPPLSYKTRLDQVIRMASPTSLTVLVTDLFQSEADEVSVVAAIKQIVNKNRFAVGIVAMKSQFEGVVYDIAPGNPGAAFQGRRPFYALLLGREIDVHQYLQQLRAPNRANTYDTHVLLLSSEISAAPVEASSPSVPKTSGLSLRRISAGPCAFTVFDARSPTGSTESATLKYSWEPMPDLPSLNLAKIVKPAVVVLSAMSRGFKTFSPDPALARSVSVSFQAAPKGIYANVALSGDSAVARGLYQVKVSVSAPVQAFSFPDWTREWNVETTQMRGSGPQAPPFDGTKTLNLYPFLVDTWTALINDRPPSLGNIYLILRKS